MPFFSTKYFVLCYSVQSSVLHIGCKLRCICTAILTVRHVQPHPLIAMARAHLHTEGVAYAMGSTNRVHMLVIHENTERDTRCAIIACRIVCIDNHVLKINVQ